MRTLVVVPTYNEAENLPWICEQVLRLTGADILVVDDNSPDGTGDIAHGLAAADRRVNLMRRPGKAGLGTAYLAGFGWGLDRGYDFVVEMDADGSHQPHQLPALIDAAQRSGAGLVIGSRWARGGSVIGFAPHRLLLSRFGNWYARIMLGLGIHDLTGGFRVYSAAALRSIDLGSVRSQGYCFQVDLARRVAAIPAAVVEVPIAFAPRRHGESKMSGRIVLEALVQVTRWGVSRRLR